MAEALAILGAVVAVPQILSGMKKAVESLARCVKHARSAPQDVIKFTEESSTFSETLQYFFEISQDLDIEVTKNQRRKLRTLARSITEQCRVVEEGTKDLIDRFDSVIWSDDTFIHRARSALSWHFIKPDMVGLRLSLTSSQNSLTLILALYHMQLDGNRNNNFERRLRYETEQIKKLMRESLDQNQALIMHQKEHSKWLVESAKGIQCEVMAELNANIRQYVAEAIHREQQHLPAREPARESRHQRRHKPGRPPIAIRTISETSPPTRSQYSSSTEAREIPNMERSLALSRPSVQPDEITQHRTPVQNQTPPLAISRPVENTVGCRVRDRGNGVAMDYGEWPSEASSTQKNAVHSGEEASAALEASSGTSFVELPPMPPKEKTQLVEEHEDRVQDGGRLIAEINTKSRPRSVISEVYSQHGSIADSEDEEDPRWQPTALFGGPGSRRKPRKPRSPSPIK